MDSPLHRIRKIATVLSLLLVFGIVRWPLESATTRDFKARHILPPDLGLAMREKLTQNSYAAAFGGARSLVASIESLSAFVDWEKFEWGKLEQRYRLITELQPRVATYWETGAWHLAYNAAGYYRYDWEGPTGDYDPAAVQAVRMEMWARYVRKGQEMFAAAVRNNPENWKLADQAAMLWADPLKIQDHQKAAHYYATAAAIDGSPQRLQRFTAYELSFQPETRAESFRRLQSLYDESESNHLPTLLALLLDMQMEAHTPENQRVPLKEIGVDPPTLLDNLTAYTLYRRSRNGDISPQLYALIAGLEKKLKVPKENRLNSPKEMPRKSPDYR